MDDWGYKRGGREKTGKNGKRLGDDCSQGACCLMGTDVACVNHWLLSDTHTHTHAVRVDVHE